MKSTLINQLAKVLLPRIGLNYRRRRNNVIRKMWRPGRTGLGTTGAARRRRGRNMKIEVNNAEGGYKQVYVNGRVQQQTIEAYVSIYINNVNEYIFKSDDVIQDPKVLDLKSILNDSNEFLQLRKQSLQWKLVQVSVSFNYNRIPKSGEKFSKLVLTPETDMVENNDNPKQNSNNMIWDMTRNGSKNYSFRINARNTEKINQEWTEGQAQFNGLLYLHISSQGINDTETNVDGICLGEFKLAFSVLYLKRDIPYPDNKVKLSNKTIMSMMIAANRIKFEQEYAKKKVEMNKKAIEKLQEANEEISSTFLNNSF